MRIIVTGTRDIPNQFSYDMIVNQQEVEGNLGLSQESSRCGDPYLCYGVDLDGQLR